ncbi:MAG TPA: hypothetical protein PLY16_02805, partial [Candidatus Saccharibacteria bacterium]|nr:hypothetical protein [Candidatus Saccharibacteria bacterium]
MTSSHKTQRLRSKKYTTWPRSYSIILTAALLAAAVFISSVILQRQASADITLVYSNGFESDTTGWAGSGTITRTVSGANGIISATDSYHAVVTGQPGPNTQFGGYGSSWPGDWQASIDVYFDPAWDAGTGFIYTVATNNISGTHLRDFALNAGVLNDETTGNVNQFVVLADPAGSPTADPLYQIK